MLPQIFAVLGTYVLEQICFCVWEDLNAVEWRNLFPLMVSLKQKMCWRCKVHLKEAVMLLSPCKCCFRYINQNAHRVALLCT